MPYRTSSSGLTRYTLDPTRHTRLHDRQKDFVRLGGESDPKDGLGVDYLTARDAEFELLDEAGDDEEELHPGQALAEAGPLAQRERHQLVHLLRGHAVRLEKPGSGRTFPDWGKCSDPTSGPRSAGGSWFLF
jgi:hypothetical protein